MAGRRAFGKAVCALLALLLPHQAQASEPATPWTPETSVEMRYFASDFGDPDAWPDQHTRPQDGILMSPDHRYFLTVELTGDAAADTKSATVHIYSSQAVRIALATTGATVPLPVARFAMTRKAENRAVIHDIEWTGDSTGIFFKGFDEEGSPTLYRFDVDGEEPRAIVGLATSNVSVAINGENWATYTPVETEESSPPAGALLWLDRRKAGYASPDGAEVFRPWGASVFPPVEPPTGTLLTSCRGKKPIAFERFTYLSALSPYPSPKKCFLVASVRPSPEDSRRVIRLVDIENERFLDLGTAVDRTLDMTVAWSPDGDILALPIQPPATEDGAYLALLDTETLALLTPEDEAGNPLSVPAGTRLHWLAADRLAVVPSEGGRTALIQRTEAGWIVGYSEISDLPQRHAIDPGFEVGIEQSPNEPPRLVAREGSRSLVLSTPDETLERTVRADWREFRFAGVDGQTYRAALMLPPKAAPGADLPLVIIPYWYDQYAGDYSEVFLPDGPHRGGDAHAQTLAANGFAVVWMDAWLRDPKSGLHEATGGPEEGFRFVRQLDFLVESLRDQDLVEPTKIGLLGFSRGGYMTLFAYTHPGRTRVDAFFAVDNYLGDIGGYFRYENAPAAALNAAPFFEDPEPWLRVDTLTNIRNSKGPIMFTQHQVGDVNPDEKLSALLPIMGALVTARRPFDVIVFSDGIHGLTRPSERVALTRAATDWMAFWLQGRLPRNTGLVDRWSKMRAQWDKQRDWEEAGHAVGSKPGAPAWTPPPAKF